MTGSLLAASWLAVRRTPLLVPCGAAVLLVAGTVPWQDSGHAVAVLHGVVVLAACGWVATLDDPAGEVVAASPYPRRRRTLLRMLAGLAVVLPVLALGASVAELRFAPTPLLPAGFEAVGYALGGAALGAALRAWRGQLTPAYPALIGLLALVLGTYWLPTGWTMVDPQPWGPPLVAALLRWSALALLALGVLTLALRDPADQ
jgi:hypothetical protein